MNAITKALTEINYQIPKEILNIGFAESYKEINSSISLDEMIMSKVIRPKVLVDCNITGGIELVINMDHCSVKYLSNLEALVNVPKSATNGKSIISVLSLIANGSIKSNIGYNSNTSSILDIGNKLFNSIGNENIIQTSRLELISDNTFIISEYNLPIISAGIRCIIENDNNLANINPRSYIAFSKLVTLAVKAYIYNNTIVRLDKGYVYGGHELGVIKDIIDNYADSYELYTEYLTTTWSKVQFLNDGERSNRYIKSMLSSIM